MSIAIEAAVTERRKVHVLEVDACWRVANYLSVGQIYLSATRARMRQFPMVWRRPSPSRMSRLWSSIICHNTCVIGGGYSAAELAQAYRRFSSDVTIIESGPQLLAREDVDVSQEMRRILSSGGITNKLIRRYRKL
jgi:pyruvate/2-oxoglutarate dehydrogenase complex dihydrolipoamide dehydrogenase (E3) component